MISALRKIKQLMLLPYTAIAPVIGKSLCALPAGVRLFADPYKQVFFGYFDISPLSPDGKTLLACRAPGENVSPHVSHPELEVGYYTLAEEGTQFHLLGRTTSWNWQQGCRLQWLPGSERVVYNVFEGGSFKARIQNIETGVVEKTLSEPIYGLAPDGRKALTLNFAHLHQMRPGYGYSQRPDLAAQGTDGLWVLDLLSDTKSLLFSMQQLASIDPLPEMTGATHYLNHLDFSPDGQKICFIHLWLTPQNKRGSRMFVCDLTGGNLRLVTNEGRDSHHCWRSDDEFLMFSKRKETGLRYHLFDLASGGVQVIGNAELREDGHPTYISRDLILSDTYPDRKRCQELFTYDMAKKVKTTLAKFYSPKQFTGELRCDLHPRTSADGKKGCVDMIHDNRRALCLFDL